MALETHLLDIVSFSCIVQAAGEVCAKAAAVDFRVGCSVAAVVPVVEEGTAHRIVLRVMKMWPALSRIGGLRWVVVDTILFVQVRWEWVCEVRGRGRNLQLWS